MVLILSIYTECKKKKKKQAIAYCITGMVTQIIYRPENTLFSWLTLTR